MKFKRIGASVSKKRSAEASADDVGPFSFLGQACESESCEEIPHTVENDNTYRKVCSLLEFFSRDVGFLINEELRDLAKDDKEVLDSFEVQERKMNLLANQAGECFSRIEDIENTNTNLHHYLLHTLDRCSGVKELMPSCKRITCMLAENGIKITIPRMNQDLAVKAEDELPQHMHGGVVSSASLSHAESRCSNPRKGFLSIAPEKSVLPQKVCENDSSTSHGQKRSLEVPSGITETNSINHEPFSTELNFIPTNFQANISDNKLLESGSQKENTFNKNFVKINDNPVKVESVENVGHPCVSELSEKTACDVETPPLQRNVGQEPFAIAGSFSKKASDSLKLAKGSFTTGTSSKFNFNGESGAPSAGSNSIQKAEPDNSGHQSLFSFNKAPSSTVERSTAMEAMGQNSKTLSEITCPFTGKSMFNDTSSRSMEHAAPAPDSKNILHIPLNKSEDEMPSSAAATSFFSSAKTDPAETKSNPFLQKKEEQKKVTGQAAFAYSWSAHPTSSFGKADLLTKKETSPSVSANVFDKTFTDSAKAHDVGANAVQSSSELSNPFLSAKGNNPLKSFTAVPNSDFQAVNPQLDTPTSFAWGTKTTGLGFETSMSSLTNSDKESQELVIGKSSIPSYLKTPGSIVNEDAANSHFITSQASKSSVFGDPGAEKAPASSSLQ
ncbi:hypothetical protein XU18_2176 [Perkinsela sp. CCAP 1560/4]|nr:hypothetical protein XU18_2176 [Perkinsela sp. CCAP 1560/4]|eukprot:KNH07131.1 hypothetical protein XU18_2176 [Perkinsela sp. CCAP 1560/4]